MIGLTLPLLAAVAAAAAITAGLAQGRRSPAVAGCRLPRFKFGVLPIPAGPDGRWSFTNGLIDAINVHSPNRTAAWELEQWLGSPTSESIMGSGGYVWPGIASLDTTFLNYWKAKGVDVSPFLEEAQDSSHVETLPVAPEAGQVIVSLYSDLGPAWLGSEPVAQAVAAAAKQADQLLQNPSQ